MVAWKLTLAAVAGAATTYPFSYNSCGVDHQVSASPVRAVTMNQGATEFLLALGLADKMVGTAYLDDAIWPKYAAEYDTIPVIAEAYPNETVLMAANPDFIVGSYFSAFLAVYEDAGQSKGIFSDATVGPCTGDGSEWELSKERTTCRPQLHAQDVGTYLFKDACENSDLRPQAVTEETVYTELRALGRIFDVDAEAVITEMKADFDAAANMIPSQSDRPLNAVWLDCVGRCCKDDQGEPDPNQVYVGSGDGAPNMLMREAGLENVFAAEEGNWKCVSKSEITAANPDVFIVVDAAWDTAVDKLKWMYNDASFCELGAMKGARFVSIPFSATTLSPRNGPAVRDLAIAALHVRLGANVISVRESGVTFFDLKQLEADVAGSVCAIGIDSYLTDSTTGDAKSDTNATDINSTDDGAAVKSIWFAAISVLLLQNAIGAVTA